MVAIDQASEAWTDWLTTCDYDVFETHTFAPKENRVKGDKGEFRLQIKHEDS